jgi:hypothetical protein
MTIKQFIEKSIEGGWRPKARDGFLMRSCVFFKVQEYESTIHFTDQPNGNVKKDFVNLRLEVIFLDPRAWRAVGKIERWNVSEPHDYKHHAIDVSLLEMHNMIDALAEGRTIEQYIETL